ncbi:MAG: type IX secretion system protein PorQ [Ignavibacteriaceae bacterium]
MKLFSFLVISFLILISNTISAQNTYEFMRLDMSARAGALGGTFVANHDDPNVIFYNPAGLKLLEESPISFSFFKHLLDINLASLSYSTELKGIGRVGGGIKYINYGTFQGATEDGLKTNEFGAGEIAFILGYANELDENFYYGVNAEFIYSSIEEHSSSAIGLDLGLHYNIPSSEANIGFSILNLGTQLSSYINTKEDLPLDVMFGASKKLEHLPLRLSLDFHRLNKDRDDFVSRLKAFTVGAEFILSKALRLRLGYDNEKRTELKIGSFAGIAGFNAGLGIAISDYNFDYGFSSMGLIGALHRISISTKL